MHLTATRPAAHGASFLCLSRANRQRSVTCLSFPFGNALPTSLSIHPVTCTDPRRALAPRAYCPSVLDAPASALPRASPQVMISALSAMGAGPFHWDESGRFLTLRGLGGRFQARTLPTWSMAVCAVARPWLAQLPSATPLSPLSLTAFYRDLCLGNVHLYR
eukprot:6187076-Pleurochrysis_carterae.AAC.2